MAIYHFSVKTISRSTGRTASGSAAYRAAEKITGPNGELYDYSRKKGVSYTEIILPTNVENLGRQELWNEVDKAEKRKNSTIAREYEIALPAEITPQERKELASEFGRYIVDRYNVAADVVIHEARDENKNYHMHVLTSTRVLTGNGFGAKTRILDAHDTGKNEIKGIRFEWERMINNVLERNGIEKVSCLSLYEQGIERLPQIHVGVSATAIERKGLTSERGKFNRERKDRNGKIQEIKNLEKELVELRAEQSLDSRKMSPELEQIRVAPPPINPEIIKQPDRSALPAELSILQRQATEREDEYLAQVRRERVAKLEQKAREEAARDARIAAAEVREKAVESEAAKIATTQMELWKTYQAADAADRAHRELEPRGMLEILGESKRHRVWVCERNELSREAIRLWEQCGGDMSATDKGEAEVVRRLTPEFARSEAEKVVETAERRELAEREKREAQKRTEAAEMEAQARQKKREKGRHKQKLEKVKVEVSTEAKARDTVVVAEGERVTCHIVGGQGSITGVIFEVCEDKIVLQVGKKLCTLKREKVYFTQPGPDQQQEKNKWYDKKRVLGQDLGR